MNDDSGKGIGIFQKKCFGFFFCHREVQKKRMKQEPFSDFFVFFLIGHQIDVAAKEKL